MKDGGVRLGAEGDKANDIYARLNDVIEAKGLDLLLAEKFRGARCQSHFVRRK